MRSVKEKDLGEIGLVYKHKDENDVKDINGIANNGIRRYFIDWELMDGSAIEYFSGW